MMLPLRTAARGVRRCMSSGGDAAGAGAFGGGWKREGLPSVAEVQWRAQYGRDEAASRLKGVPKKEARGRTAEEQREYIRTKDQLGGAGTGQRAGKVRTKNVRFADWREEQKRIQKDVARQQEMQRGKYSDDLIQANMTNMERSQKNVVDEALVASFQGVDLSLPTVRRAVERLEGVDLAFSDQLTLMDSPPALVLPNTAGKYKDAVRETLSAADYTATHQWYTERPRTVLLITEDNRGGVEWARACPEATFIVVSQTVSGFFRTVTNGTVAEGEDVPANMRFVRTSLPFYFFTDDAVPDESIDEVVFQQPNAFASEQKAYKRLPDKDFLQLLHPKLKVGGHVRLVTASVPFYDWVHLEFQKSFCEWQERDAGDVDAQLPHTVRAAATAAVAPWAPERGNQIRRAQEWVKPSATPERVHDMNAAFHFYRRNHHTF